MYIVHCTMYRLSNKDLLYKEIQITYRLEEEEQQKSFCFTLSSTRSFFTSSISYLLLPLVNLIIDRRLN